MLKKIFTCSLLSVALVGCASNSYSYNVKTNQRKQVTLNQNGAMIDDVSNAVSTDYAVLSLASASSNGIIFNNEIYNDNGILDNNVTQSGSLVTTQEYLMIVIKMDKFYNKMVIIVNSNNVLTAAYVSDDINIKPLYIDPKSSGIKADIKTYYRKTNWTANVMVPYSLIGGKSSSYQFNILRQASLVKHNVNNPWVCAPGDCKVFSLAPIPGYQMDNRFGIDSFATLNLSY